ncbi:ComF family protein [Candidatus Microgenomates bacterium]|nr:MAG: ComF family protein [Candidatus Microgenomates bacterium]
MPKLVQHGRENLILVPIPLYKSKLKSRGYNQAEILAQELVKRLDPSSRKAGLRMTIVNLLERVKNTKTQVGLKQKERKENIAGAFKIRNGFCHLYEPEGSQSRRPEFISGSREIPKPASQRGEQVWNDNNLSVLLIDDVLTTGSTLLEAANVLKRNGIKKVWGVTLAKD